jgi:uroporphyrinogen decarboxylase
VEDYDWPTADWFDFSHLKEEIKRINERERHFICYFAGGAFETPWYMRGMEQFLVDLALQPEIAAAISRKAQEFYTARALKALEQSDGQIDMIGSGGDIGTQKGMMLAPRLWREHIKPYSKKLIRGFKDMGYYTFYHSCGSIVPVIEDLIEIGLDVLDPVQISAAGMDPQTLKTRFGDRLSFHGGVDEQTMLPVLAPPELEQAVCGLIDILGRDGGYIPCAAHALQPDTPVENILTLYRTIAEYRYP